MKFLIVDDEALIRKSLSRAFKVSGFDCDEAENGKQALTLGNLLCRAFDAKPVIAYRGGEKVPEMNQGYFKNTADKSPTKGLRMLTDQVKPMAVVVGAAVSDGFGRGKSGSGGKRILSGGNCPIAVSPPASRDVHGLSAICVAVDGHGTSEFIATLGVIGF